MSRKMSSVQAEQGPWGPPASSAPRKSQTEIRAWITQTRQHSHASKTESWFVSEVLDNTGTNCRMDGSHTDDATVGAWETVQTGLSPKVRPGALVRFDLHVTSRRRGKWSDKHLI